MILKHAIHTPVLHIVSRTSESPTQGVLDMGINLPPNLANTGASAIVRGVEKDNSDPTRKQEEDRIKNEGMKAQEAAKK